MSSGYREYRTSEFIFAHGKAPRGKGHWVFQAIAHAPGWQSQRALPGLVEASTLGGHERAEMTYSEAKRAVGVYYPEVGVWSVCA